MDAIDKRALVGLPNLERAEALAGLLERHNCDQQTLAEQIGVKGDTMSRYMTPMKLSADTRNRIRAIPVDKRPLLDPLEILCRVEPPLQLELLEALPLDLSAKKQAQWLKEICTARGIALSKDRYRRQYRAQRIDRLTLATATLARKVRWYIDEIIGMAPEGRDIALAVEDYPKRVRMLWDALQVLLQELGTFEPLLESSVSKAKAIVPQKLLTRPIDFTVGFGCMWPIGDPGHMDFKFCGAPAVSGKPYCADHNKIAYLKRSQSRRGITAN